MPDRFATGPPDPLERQLAALAGSIAWPSAPDLPATVARRLADAPAPAGAAGRGWRSRFVPRPARRALLAAAALLLALAAVAAAATLLFPGLRLVTLPPGSTPPPVPSRAAESPVEVGLGFALGLGVRRDLAEAEELAGFPPVLPADPAVGAPDEVHVAGDRVNLLWRSRPALPETEAAGVGLIVTELRGRVHEGWFEKQLVEGATTVEQVRIGGSPGFWVTGEPHVLVYVDERGRELAETRRVVGDVLIWRRGELTIRIESALGRDATIALAETFRDR